MKIFKKEKRVLVTLDNSYELQEIERLRSIIAEKDKQIKSLEFKNKWLKGKVFFYENISNSPMEIKEEKIEMPKKQVVSCGVDFEIAIGPNGLYGPVMSICPICGKKHVKEISTCEKEAQEEALNYKINGFYVGSKECAECKEKALAI